MAVEDWINLNFSEAIEYFRNKDPKPNPGMIQRLRADYHDTSFVVAGLAKADLVSGIHRLLLQAMEQGQDFNAFKANFDQQIKDKGWRPGGARLQIVFDTNFRRSHAAGRYRQAIEIIKERPYWLWRHRDSPKFRPHHKALHNKAIPANHSFWKTAIPPCGYGCRCTFFAVDEDTLNRMGASILTDPPDPKTIADPGFRGVPTNQARLRKQIIDTGAKRQTPTVKNQFKQEF